MVSSLIISQDLSRANSTFGKSVFKRRTRILTSVEAPFVIDNDFMLSARQFSVALHFQEVEVEKKRERDVVSDDFCFYQVGLVFTNTFFVCFSFDDCFDIEHPSSITQRSTQGLCTWYVRKEGGGGVKNAKNLRTYYVHGPLCI